VTSPAVTQATIATTICRSGYTKTVRPPVSVTSPEKTANAASCGYTGPLSVAEYDHLISLEIGGDPNDPRNLWLENYRGSFNAHDKIAWRTSSIVPSAQGRCLFAQLSLRSRRTG
jgi:hypothetical protein